MKNLASELPFALPKNLLAFRSHPYWFDLKRTGSAKSKQIQQNYSVSGWLFSVVFLWFLQHFFVNIIKKWVGLGCRNEFNRGVPIKETFRGFFYESHEKEKRNSICNPTPTLTHTYNIRVTTLIFNELLRKLLLLDLYITMKTNQYSLIESSKCSDSWHQTYNMTDYLVGVIFPLSDVDSIFKCFPKVQKNFIT